MRELRKNLNEEDLKLVIQYGEKEIPFIWDREESLRENESVFWDMMKSFLEIDNWGELDKDTLSELIEIWEVFLDCILTPDVIIDNRSKRTLP